jgi:hypothetical protein
MLVCLLFFNFAMLFDFGYYSLAQEMSFVDCYLPYFRQHLFTCRLSALLPFQSLFTESLHGDKLLAPPLFSDALEHPALSAVCLFQFLAYYSVLFFLWGGGQSAQGVVLFYLRSSCGNTACNLFTQLLVCITQAGLELVSGGTGALLFFSVMWRGEALYRLGVQGVIVSILLGGFFLPSVAPASQQNF